MSWTDERVERLKKLYAEGVSASQIAKHLGGGVSRNAVIGKVHRLGLDGGVRQKPSAPRIRTTAPMGRPPTSATPRPRPKPAPIGPVHIDPFNARSVPLGQRPPEPSPEIDSAPLGEPKTLLELGRRDCRWPLSKTFDEATADTLFCGQRVALREGEPTSWCKVHMARVFSPKQPKPLRNFDPDRARSAPARAPDLGEAA